MKYSVLLSLYKSNLKCGFCNFIYCATQKYRVNNERWKWLQNRHIQNIKWLNNLETLVLSIDEVETLKIKQTSWTSYL